MKKAFAALLVFALLFPLMSNVLAGEVFVLRNEAPCYNFGQ